MYTSERRNSNNNINKINPEKNSHNEREIYSNIYDILEIEREFVNFSLSFPGEILSVEFNIRNISNINACFEVGFSQKENLLKIFKKYYQSDINEAFKEVPNSQIQFKCFSLSYLEEDNNLVEMDKIRIFLKKGQSTKLILCLKSPQIKKKICLFSAIEFSLVINDNSSKNYNYNNSISNNEYEDYYRNEKTHNIKSKNEYNFNPQFQNPEVKFLIKNEKHLKSYMPILGSVDIPKLLCLKELYNEKATFPLISLLLEIKSKGQKFKIPFKNFSLKDMEIELIFEKLPINKTIFHIGEKYYECQFLCFPNRLAIPSHGVCEIELIAKIKKFKVSNTENFVVTKIGKKIRKVLIAKVKNASVYYSFFIEASFIKKKEK